MATTYQMTPIIALPAPNATIVDGNETFSTHYLPQTKKTVKAGCHSHSRRAHNSDPARKAQLKRAAKAQMKLYLRYTWIDSLILAIFGLVILCLYWAPNNLRSTPLLPIWPAVPIDGTYIPGKFLDLRAPTEFQHLWQKSPLNDFVCALLVTLVPIIVIAFFQIKVRSTWDFHAGHIGILRAVTTTALIVSILKHYVGGLRPHYVDVCQPNKTMVAEYIQMHYMQLENHNFFNSSICTGHKHRIKTALQSFPSGHAANAFAAAIFLALYMNAKMKIIGDHCSHYWAFFIMTLPLLLAAILSAEMYLTHHHHARDIYCGIVLGLVFGTLAYRSVYAALFDPRFNHIPLPPFSSKTQLSYRDTGSVVVDSIDLDENTDKLVVWRWWRSRPTNEGREKEDVWLRDIRPKTGVCDSGVTTGPILPQNEGDVLTLERVEERTTVS